MMRSSKRSLVLAVDPAVIPTAQQKGIGTCRSRKKIGKVRGYAYTKSEVRRAARILAKALRASTPSKMCEQMDEDVDWFINVVFVYALPESYPKYRYGTWKRTSPDGDNMLKLLQDVITESKLYWLDDRLVQIEGVYRRYQTRDEPPRILIGIRCHKQLRKDKDKDKERKRKDAKDE